MSNEIHTEEQSQVLDGVKLIMGTFTSALNDKELFCFQYDESIGLVVLYYIDENQIVSELDFDYALSSKQITIYFDSNKSWEETFYGELIVEPNGHIVIVDKEGNNYAIKVSEEVELPSEETELPSEETELPSEETELYSEYLLIDSNTRVYLENEFSGWTLEELRLARNEIFARHGYIFNSEDLSQYFGEKDWYIPLISSEDFNAENEFNNYEKTNIELIKQLEDLE